MKKTKHVEISAIGSFFSVDENGFLINPTSSEKIQSQWQPVVNEISSLYQNIFEGKLQNIYVRGSVAKGQAVENISDIDTLVYVDLEKYEINYDLVCDVERKIITKYPFVESVEFSVLPKKLTHRDNILLTQALCIYGDPLDVPFLKIDKNLAIHAPSFHKRMEKFQHLLDQEKTSEQVKAHCMWQMKGLLRIGAEILIERSKKYTRDLYKCYEIFSEYYPEKESDMREILYLALNPTDDKEKIKEMMSNFGTWLLGETKKYF